MRRFLLFAIKVIILFSLPYSAAAQTSQTVDNGSPTAPINFPGTGCVYKWVNDTPGIGLAASGSGNIPSFIAINKGTTPITATITATPVQTGFVYITNENDDTVSVIDTATHALVATIPVGSKPIGVAVSPDGGRVYVANSHSNTISVISTITNTVEATITNIPSAYGVAVSPDGTAIYVTNTYTDNLSVINALTYAVMATIPVGIEPTGVCVSSDGSRVYVTNVYGGNVSVINTATDLVIATIPAGGNPYGICVSRDGSHVYVANQASNNVSAIDVSTNIITLINVGEGPFGIALSPDGSRLYVGNSGTGAVGAPPPGTVSVINTSNNLVTATFGVGIGPAGISFSPDGGRAYIANNYDNTVSVINTANNTVIATAPVGGYPSALGNFVAAGNGCGTTPITFTIEVLPKTLPPTIIADTVKGSISACEGTASLSPNIQQFTVSGANLTDNVMVTAPAGFEVSLNADSGYSANLTLTPSGGTASSTIVYVRAAATAVKGNISDKVTLSSAGATNQYVAVAANINPVPSINPIADQTVNSGGITKAVNFTGTGNSYTWTNDTPSIGLAAGGSGNISPFKAVNNTLSPITATITVTPLPNKPGRFAYIPNASANTVSVINTATNEVVTTIPVGLQPECVAASPDGSRVYISNNLSNSVSVISVATNKVIAVIAVGPNPWGLCVSPDGSKVYVSNSINVSVIDAATNTVTKNIEIGEYPNQLAISPDGSRLYVTNSYGGANSGVNSDFYVVNTATDTVIATIEVGQDSNGVAVSPDGKLVYVANTFSNNISVINTATNKVSATIPVDIGPYGLCISPDGSRLYETNSGDQMSGVLEPGTMSVINTGTDKVIATIPVDTYPIGISVSSDGSHVYVANDFGKSVANSGETVRGTVSVINTAGNQVEATVYVGYNAISFGNFLAELNGCSGIPITFTITVNPAGPVVAPGDIVIPNTFTPNGDGINDTWDIKNLDGYANCMVQIFNRYGENVYSSVGYGTPWDGRYKGSALPTGTYYYIVDLKNGSKLFSGFVAIIR